MSYPTPASGYETRIGDASGPVHTDSGDIIILADRARETLQRVLPTGGEARAELHIVVAELMELQAQMAEWKELHHLLHKVLTAFAPFHARLVPSNAEGFTTAERQALLQNWRPCQDEIDVLTDFACGIEHIGKPFARAGRELRGERWAVEIVALQLLLEDALKEESPSPTSLLELAEEFNSACHRHLTLADRKLRAVVDKLQQLSTRLLGGIL